MKQRKNDDLFAANIAQQRLGGLALRGGAITAAAQAASLLLHLGSTILLARLLTPEAFGLIAMVVAITGFAALFSDLGLSIATIQRGEITHAQVSALFWVNVTAGSVIGVLVAALSPIIAWFYAEPRLTSITLVIASTFVLGGIAAQHKALLQRRMQLDRLAAIDLTALLAGIATAVILAASGAGYWALVSSLVVNSAITASLSWAFSGWRPGRPTQASGLRSLLAVGGNLTGFNLVNYAVRNLDNVLIGWWWGASPLGLYDRAYRLFMFPLSQINQPISRIAIPVLARLQGDPTRYKRAYLRMLGMLLITIIPGVVFILATADWLIPTLLGAQWAHIVPIFSWLALAALVQPLNNTVGWLFITQDRSREMLQWGLVGGGLSILSFLAGLPWGPTGVAACYAVSGLLIRTPLVLWWVSRRGAIRGKDFTDIIFPFATAAAMAGTCLFGLRQLLVLDSAPDAAASFILSYVVSLVTLAAFRPGRRVLGDLLTLIRRIDPNALRG